MTKKIVLPLMILSVGLTLTLNRLRAVEIPLETLTPVRIGYVDLQRIFDTYPEKSFAEGDLLREIEKRKRELARRQSDVSLLQGQISADNAVLTQAKAGQAVIVPVNNVPVIETPLPIVVKSTGTVKTSSPTIEAYPSEDPLAGLPGHEAALEAGTQNTALPGMNDTTKKRTLLDDLAAQTTPALLSKEALDALQKRVDEHQRRLDRAVVEFRTFRGNAIADMRVLQTQKTEGVMSKIYAVLQDLARDENVMVVLDKAYVLYGENAVDLSDKLIDKLQGAGG